MLFTADRKATLLHMSEPLARMLGADVGRGTKLSARVHPEDRRVFRSAWTRLDRSGEPAEFDCRLRAADGAYHTLRWRARASEKHGVVHGSLQNGFAEHTPSPAEPPAPARILRHVQENVPLVVWEIDPQGIFTHHAGKALATAGIADGQWLGKNIFELYGDGQVRAVREALAGEVQHDLSEAHGVHWESWEIPVRDREGRVTSVIGISLDVTQTKRAEAELREKLALIERQAEVIRALSTPIIEIWDRVVTVPLLGVLDSRRAAEVTENLLSEISRKGARFAILDLTGVEAIDTATAGHMIRMIHAIRLLGAVGVISGIQPGVAQTMVSIGIDLKDIATFATLRDALRICMARLRDGAAQPAS